MCGEQLLFQRADMIEREWAAVAPVLDAWGRATGAPEPYPAGSAGPSGADRLLARDGESWLPVASLDEHGAAALNATVAPAREAVAT
jgi:glucose-6-phosphate 1-dehydrogenase